QISNHILDFTKGRHDIGTGRADIGSAIDHDLVELVLGNTLGGADEIRPVGAAGPVRPMAPQAGLGVATPAVERLLVDLPILDHVRLLITPCRPREPRTENGCGSDANQRCQHPHQGSSRKRPAPSVPADAGPVPGPPLTGNLAGGQNPAKPPPSWVWWARAL